MENDDKKVVMECRSGDVLRGHMVYCPACKTGHVFDERWKFNGDMMKPTFTPSMLVHIHEAQKRCHSYVTDGNIKFLDDCGHELKGQTVPLEAIY